MLISGGEVTVATLFVNNSNGRLGLVGYWDVVAFDEFAGKKKRSDRALVDIMRTTWRTSRSPAGWRRSGLRRRWCS